MTTVWTAAREQMLLDPAVTMLNTGSFGPTPRPVFAAADGYRQQMAMGPTNFFLRTLPPLLWDARVKTAAFLGTAPDRFVFTTNVSAAVNLVAGGLTLSGPGDVLMTDHEYGSMIWCWERAAARQGLEVKTFPLPTMPREPGEIVEAAVRAMTPRTKLFFFSHALSPTGMILPARELCAEARRRGILTVVDGAHAPAMIPLDVDDVGADYYAGNCHKWLLAPSGSGFLAVRDWDRPIEPPQVSWGYKTDADPKPVPGPDGRDVYGSTPRTRRLEFPGTTDVCPWLATPAAIAFQEAFGWDAIRDRHAELAAYSRRTFDKLGLKLANPADRRLCGSMTTCELPAGVSGQAVRAKLWDHRIEIGLNERPDRVLLRISHHFYTTEAEIDRLADVLGSVLDVFR